MTHTWTVIAFVLLAAAAILSGTQKAWAICLIAAGLAVELVPAVFQLAS